MKRVVMLVALLWPGLSVAGDGVLEINQSCAVNTGCFPGDTAGYPVTITGAAGRSYRLTGDLNINDPDTSVIQVEAGSITIDLGGFGIACTTFVPPSTIQPCGAGPAGGTGVGIDASLRDGVTIRNGSVVGMGSSGIEVGRGGTIERVKVLDTGFVGISISSGIVRECVVNDNAEAGISGDEALISRNVVQGNTFQGIQIGRSGLVEGNVVTGNGSDGIFGDSIGALIRGNTTNDNGNFGIRMGFKDGYSGNVAIGNSAGQISGGNNLGGNYCAAADGSNTCP